MNAHCERFNRTIQESFVDYHEDLLFTDLDAFNQELADWLVFYNTERPHQALALLSPVQSLMINQPECHMLWTYTSPGQSHYCWSCVACSLLLIQFRKPISTRHAAYFKFLPTPDSSITRVRAMFCRT